MTIRTITGTIEYADGSIPQNSRAEFYLNGVHIDAVTIAHSAVYVPLDETGDITVDLYPNDVGYGADRYNVDLVTYSDSEYIREIRRVNLGKIYVADEDGQILQDLLAVFTGPAVPLGVAQQAAQDAIDAAAAASAALAALYDGPTLDTVADLLADTALTYTAGQPRTVTPGDFICTRAEGISYEVAPSSATDHHVATAGGVKLYVQASGEGYNVAAFGAVGDGVVDDTVALLAAIDASHAIYNRSGIYGTNPILGVTLTGGQGARYAFSGRLRVKPGVTLDLGHGPSGSTLVALDATGGVELEGGAVLRGGLAVGSGATYTGPMLELNDTKTSTAFGQSERQTEFDVCLHAGRQAGSVGVLMQSDAGSAGIAWVRGRVTVDEFDYGVRMVSNNDGYVNSCELDISTYDPVEALDIKVNGTGEIDSNRITLVNQTGANGRSGRVLRCDGRKNTIYIKSWDWSSAKLNPSYSGEQVIFSDLSGKNNVNGEVARAFGFDRMAVIDLAPQIRKNFIELDDQRIYSPATRTILPQSFLSKTAVGDLHDELAFAYYRYRNQVVAGASVTGSGATPPTTDDLRFLFDPSSRQLAVNNATETIVTVDLGAVRSGSDFSTVAVLFNDPAQKPDKCKVDFSTDGVTWSTQLQAGYNGDLMPDVLHRVDGGGLSSFRYVRLTCQNNSPKNLRVARLCVLGYGQSSTGGAYVPLVNPVVHKSIDIQREFGGEGLKINGQQVVTIRLAAIADATAGTEVATINVILARLRSHGLIAT